MRQPPNILFVLSDQQRSTALGCAGLEDVRTPHLDRLAGQGSRFTNAVANTPTCSPARATLLTGLHTLNHDVIQNDLPLALHHVHLAQALTSAGYRCGYIGKWHVHGGDRSAFIPPGPHRRGFDDFWAVANCTHDYLAAHYYLNDDPEPYWHQGYEPFSQTDMALEYLRSRGQAADQRPFCLFLAYGTPHFPYMNAPQPYRDQYPPGSFRLPPNCRPETPVDYTHVQWGMYEAGAQVADIIAGYYAHTTALDDCLGRVLSALDDLGLCQNTIVVFTSDHGDMLYNHGQIWKAKPWRDSIGIPLLVRWPDQIPAGRVSDAPVGLVDLMPTLLGLAGLPVPSGLDGQDLSALFKGDESAAPSEQFINYPCMEEGFDPPSWRGVVTRRHTYVRTNAAPILLYDDKIDPFQFTNLVDSPAQAATVTHLEARTQHWMTRTADRLESPAQLLEKLRAKQLTKQLPPNTGAAVKVGQANPSRRRHRQPGQGF